MRLKQEFTRADVSVKYRCLVLEKTVVLQSRQLEVVGSAMNEAHRRINCVVEYALAANRRADEVNGRVDRVAEYSQAVKRRADGVVEYAAAVNHQLPEFKSFYLRHLHWKGAIGAVAGLMSSI
mmetsp:Transcript_9170/g.24175  ORF Transcript_9170/g.24175 Transcript_9170/m.24175 type:complete len:123 (-) Transcript_9170:51-419(-)